MNLRNKIIQKLKSSWFLSFVHGNNFAPSYTSPNETQNLLRGRLRAPILEMNPITS